MERECVLCQDSYPAAEVSKYGECRECRDEAGHLVSEGYDPF